MSNTALHGLMIEKYKTNFPDKNYTLRNGKLLYFKYEEEPNFS